MKSVYHPALLFASSMIFVAWIFIAGALGFLSLASQRSPSSDFIGFLVLPFIFTAAGILVSRIPLPKAAAALISIVSLVVLGFWIVVCAKGAGELWTLIIVLGLAYGLFWLPVFFCRYDHNA